MLHPIYALRAKGHSAEYDFHLAHTGLLEFCGHLDGGIEHYQEAIRRMGHHLYSVSASQAGKTHFLDKTPRYYQIIPELAEIFPQARFIFLVRNPLSVLHSILNLWVKEHWVLLGRYKHDLLTAPAKIVEGSELLKDRALTVHYEELVQDAEGVMRLVCRHLDLAYDPEMIVYGRAKELEKGMGDHTNIDRFDRPVVHSLKKWQALAQRPQSRHFALKYLNALGPDLLSRMGYSHGQMLATLKEMPSGSGKVTHKWGELISPDRALSDRLVVIELALLWHRRLVRRLHHLLMRICRCFRIRR